ncbi:MAG: hypothetical protein O7C59_09375, partial [Rickettsia endosymbiont of Ixodes persulcatus]|nr:hypothetical protein [Rickettsia endosymbiont of Ixodes persulcatus]
NSERRCPFRELGQLCLLFAVSLFVIDAGYGFVGVGKKLGEFTFISKILTGHDEQERSGNRFVGSSLGELPVPVPEEYLQGRTAARIFRLPMIDPVQQSTICRHAIRLRLMC